MYWYEEMWIFCYCIWFFGELDLYNMYLFFFLYLFDMDNDFYWSCFNFYEINNLEICMLWGFKVDYLNVNCFFNKLDSVKELIEKYFFDILVLFEIWFIFEISDSEIFIMGYLIVWKDW